MMPPTASRWIHPWLTARSMARGLPAPVADQGGYRVDTRSDAEVRRWVFAHVDDGLVRLGRTVREPRHLLKLCGTGEALIAPLPDHWRLHDPSYFMIATGHSGEAPLADGYRLEAARRGAVTHVRIIGPNSDLAAQGFGAETDDVFVYDRISTEGPYRRRGLGRCVMAALGRAKRNPATTELLVATAEGRALYETLGWEMISPYATASIPDRAQTQTPAGTGGRLE